MAAFDWTKYCKIEDIIGKKAEGKKIPSHDAIKMQYDKLAGDWRHINLMIWGVPAVAISIMTGLVFAAYQLEGWPRIISLGVGALLLFALTVEVIKKRLLMSAISERLRNLEKDSRLEEFPVSTRALIKYVTTDKNPDESDPIYKLFKWSYARQYLTYVTFVAGIVVSILTEWEFVKYFDYKLWAYLVGIIPVVIISIGVVIVRDKDQKACQEEKNKKS
jgi:hypothetical protein